VNQTLSEVTGCRDRAARRGVGVGALGGRPPVVFFHGEPTWSCLWRHVIQPVRDAGFRCIAVRSRRARG
jgi:pimeloyl-ACP methyl ester carboxylesterase